MHEKCVRAADEPGCDAWKDDVHLPTAEEAVTRSAATLAEVITARREHECHTGALTLTVRPTGRHGGDGIRRIG